MINHPFGATPTPGNPQVTSMAHGGELTLPRPQGSLATAAQSRSAATLGLYAA